MLHGALLQFESFKETSSMATRRITSTTSFTMRQEPCCWDEMRRCADCRAARQAFVSGATKPLPPLSLSLLNSHFYFSHNPAVYGTRMIVEGAALATPRSCPWLGGTPHVKAWVALAVYLTSNPKHIVPCETWFCRVRRRLSV